MRRDDNILLVQKHSEEVIWMRIAVPFSRHFIQTVEDEQGSGIFVQCTTECVAKRLALLDVLAFIEEPETRQNPSA